MADRQQDGLRDRAAARVEDDFKAQRDGQAKEQKRETDRLAEIRQQEIRSFASNRAEADRLHRRAVAELDANERRALQDLGAKQRSLTGRVAGLVRGPGHQERQREAVSNAYEKQRLEKHIGHEALKERQDRSRIEATQRHDANLKTMQDRHRQDRRDMADRQEANRERLTGERTAAMRQTAEQTLRQEMQRLQSQDQQQDKARTIGH